MNRLTEESRLQSSTRTTSELVSAILETKYETLPTPVVHATKRVILDTIAATVGAFGNDIADALVAIKKRQSGSREATLMVDGTMCPVETVAHVHGQLANLLDADDTMIGKGHFASTTVAAALAVAEREGSSGEELIAAVACGYEVTARIAHALHQSVLGEDGTLGSLFGFSWMSFGAAAAAAKLMGLSVFETACALGQTYVLTPVVFDIVRHNRPLLAIGEPAYWHRYQVPGAAAEAGVNGALYAREGYVAQHDLFDEGNEFWRSFGAAGFDWALMHDGLPDRWYIEDAAFKVHPFCRFGSAALDLFSNIVETKNLSSEDIESVVVRIPPMAQQLQQAVENTYVDEPLKLFVSLPTAFALIADRVPPGPRWWDQRLDAEPVREFASKVRCEINPEWTDVMNAQLQGDGACRRLPTEVIVNARGAEHRNFSEYAVGDPWSPAHSMSDDEIAAKVRRFGEGRLTPESIEVLIAAAFALETAPSVADLVSGFAGHIGQ